jgi:hypothetical protein
VASDRSHPASSRVRFFGAEGRRRSTELGGPAARFAAGALVLVLVAELAARLIAPALPPGEYDDLTNDHLARLEAREEPPDTMLVGASEIGAGVDPGRLEQAATSVGNVHTFWLAGVAMRTIADLAIEVVLPQHPPERIVIGVTSREFNDENPEADQFHQELTGTFGYRSDLGSGSLLERVEREVGRVSALVRYRYRLSAPADALRSYDSSYLNAQGMLLDRLHLETLTLNEAHLDQERAALADYQLSQIDLAQLRSLIGWAQDRDVEVAVIQMPVHERHYLALQPGLDEADARYQHEVEALVADAGAEYLDPRRDLDWDDPDLWGDVNHLNRRGSERLTDWLGAELDRLAELRTTS